LGVSSSWCNTRRILFSDWKLRAPAQKEKEVFSKKWPNIPSLSNYKEPADASFWKNFPARNIPKVPVARVNVGKIEEKISECKNIWTCHQNRRGEKLLSDLKLGAGSYQKTNLPPLSAANAKSAFDHGVMLTDKIATWVSEGLVAGPFLAAPFPGFRANSLMAIDRNNAIRPVINMSGPKEESFNSNIDKLWVEKVKMASAKNFSFTVLEAGRGAKMSKFDLKDAFKIIPAKPSDWRLQGFSWLGRHFFETQMIFGAATSVSNFDRLGSTIADLSLSMNNINRKWLARTLDDFAFASPRDSHLTEKFSAHFANLCKELEIKTAAPCPLNEKAFVNETRGVVLGIGFDTAKLEWYLTEEKSNRFLERIVKGLESSHLDLKQTESIMGSINNLAQIFPFLKPFQSSGNHFLARFRDNYNLLLMPEERVREDWHVFGKACVAAKKGIPIARERTSWPLMVTHIFSDAAGAKYDILNGERHFHHEEGWRGAAFLAIEEKPFKWSRIAWSPFLLEKATDSYGKHYGNKPTTLEAVAILLPFLCIPGLLAGKQVVAHIDNVAVVWGIEKGYIKGDSTASLFVRALLIICGYLGIVLHANHVPRKSTKGANLADQLTRESSWAGAVEELGKDKFVEVKSEALSAWIRDPKEDWGLVKKLLEEVENDFIV